MMGSAVGAVVAICPDVGLLSLFHHVFAAGARLDQLVGVRGVFRDLGGLVASFVVDSLIIVEAIIPCSILEKQSKFSKFSKN